MTIFSPRKNTFGSLGEAVTELWRYSWARAELLETGVYWHEAPQTDLLFITLQKAERDYSPTTRYLDYAISETLFHWESQASTAADSTRGLNQDERPMQITWRLDHALPGDIFTDYRAAVA